MTPTRLSPIAAVLPLLLSCSAQTGALGSDRSDRTPAPTPTTEICNGADEDLDGLIDEGCPCSPGQSQSCWPGDPRKRGVGACVEGSQVCGDGGEFGTWGECFGALPPGPEVPGNCVDEDCDGSMPGCGEPCAEFEICDNGADDDCDGAVDCADADCPCGTDPCVVDPASCACEERCVPGAERFCDEPRFCFWGLQQCAPDGSWGACVETDRVPPGCEDDFPVDLPFVPSGTTYDPRCCVEAGLCCQNFGYDPSLDIDASVGNCTGITETVCTPR